MWPQTIVFDTWELRFEKVGQISKDFLLFLLLLLLLESAKIRNDSRQPKTPRASTLGFGNYHSMYWTLTLDQASTNTACVPSPRNSPEIWGQLLSYFMDKEAEVQRAWVAANNGTQPSCHQGWVLTLPSNWVYHKRCPVCFMDGGP